MAVRGRCGRAIRLASYSRAVKVAGVEMAEEPAPGDMRELLSAERLAPGRVTLVYTLHHHLGDFVVMGGLLRKFEQLAVPFEALVAHRGSVHVGNFAGEKAGRFFDVSGGGGIVALARALRRRRRAGRVVMGVPMAPGSLQAFGFLWLLKKLGALDYIVDFNLINADVLTPPRRRYIFDRHLAQAAELFRTPAWLADTSMPLAIACGETAPAAATARYGFFPWSARGQLPEFNWPEARWAQLAERILTSFDGEFVLLGRDARFRQFAETLRAQLPLAMQSRFRTEESTSVPELAAGLQGLSGLVTLNTSALHIAHALRLPTVALCGSSAELWLPESPQVRLVRDTRGALPPSDGPRHDPLQPSVQRLSVDEVYEACWDLFALSRPGFAP